MLFKLITNIFVGGNNMVTLYVALIIKKRRKFSQVPSQFQDAVREDLEALGLDENGDPVEY